MKKLAVLILTIFIATLIAGLYGILHDQITYSLSPEYYAKFKFIQFGLADEDLALSMPDPRWSVGVVGFLATYWTGIIVGLGLGLTGLIFRDAGLMFRAILKAIVFVTFITILTGIVGGLYGRFYLAKKGVDWWLPDHLVHKRDFITVGSIHNFSYFGGLLGLVIGIVYLIRKNRAIRTV